MQAPGSSQAWPSPVSRARRVVVSAPFCGRHAASPIVVPHRQHPLFERFPSTPTHHPHGRKGQTYYPHILCQFPSDEQASLELDISEELLAAKNKANGGKLAKTYAGPAADVFARVLRGLSGAKLTRPGAFRDAEGSGFAVRCSFKASCVVCVHVCACVWLERGGEQEQGVYALCRGEGGRAVDCAPGLWRWRGNGCGGCEVQMASPSSSSGSPFAMQADDGYLYPLERAFFYVQKPPLLLVFDEIEAVEFLRPAQGAVAARGWRLPPSPQIRRQLLSPRSSLRLVTCNGRCVGTGPATWDGGSGAGDGCPPPPLPPNNQQPTTPPTNLLQESPRPRLLI